MKIIHDYNCATEKGAQFFCDCRSWDESGLGTINVYEWQRLKRVEDRYKALLRDGMPGLLRQASVSFDASGRIHGPEWGGGASQDEELSPSMEVHLALKAAGLL